MSRDANGLPVTRREALSISSAAALAGLAGCGGRLRDRLTGGPETIDAAALTEATRGETPTVPETLPVDIERAFVEEQRNLARSKLDATPVPFDEDEIPNGVIRERLNGAYDDALRSIRDVSGAPTAYERLGHATRARTSAHEVEAGWGAIESDLTADDLRESVPAVRDDVDAFVRRRSYVGGDPLRAAVVHAEIDVTIRGARNWLSIPEREFEAAAGQSLELAGIAVDVERARSDVAVGSYLFDRYRAGLDDPADLRDRLSTARETLQGRIERQADSLPSERVEEPTSLVDRDVELTAGVRALAELGPDARWRIEEAHTDDGGPSLAADAMHAVGTLLRIRAYRRLRDRIEAGDEMAVTSAEDVAAFRSEAITAVETAHDADRGAPVIDSRLPTLSRRIERIDARFDRGSGGVPVDDASHHAMRYVVVVALCRALPETASEAAAVLRGSE